MVLLPRSTERGAQLFTRRGSWPGRVGWRAGIPAGTLESMSGRCAAAALLAAVLFAALPVAAAPRPWTDMTQGLLEVARAHRRTLEASIPRRERDLREASASLDR